MPYVRLPSSRPHPLPRLCLVLVLVLTFLIGPMATLAPQPAGAQSALPPLPAGWPTTLQLGMADAPGGAADLDASTPLTLRYQYLAGGVNTGNGWATWNQDGHFVTYYIQDSVDHGFTPAFTYYMIYQSTPGSSMNEVDGVYANLNNTGTMTAYYQDLKLFFQRAGAFPGTRVVLHVEPDMWGFIQQRASNDNASTVSAKVAATGLPELAGLPNTAAGVGRAVVKLRDTYAPNVLLGYHLSVWGTGTDMTVSDPSDATVDALATRAATFYQSLGANFDLVVGEFSDRDAAFKEYVYGDGGVSWMDADDFRRHARFLVRFVSTTQKRVVLWQIPLGNTKMRAMNNTWNHYQDNRVEWLLDDASATHLLAYRDAGVIGLWFGRGADGATCACDANEDGVTNPSAINGNSRSSLNADDDGGYFKERAAAYYAQGPLSLNGGTPFTPPSTPPGATTWYFAEGYTGPGFDAYLTILNPNADAAPVAITYYLSDGSTVPKALMVASYSRVTVAIHETAYGVGRNKEVSAKVTTTNSKGIVVERPMYFTYGAGITGGHTVMGATAPRSSWYFAEGYTGPGFDEYLTILNPNTTPAAVAITYFLRSGNPIVKNITVSAASRRTVTVHDTSEGVGRNQEVAATVETTNGVGIVVERPMYFVYQAGAGPVDGGHIALGAAGPRTAWYFAEGYTAENFHEYLTIANPQNSAAQVRITYYLDSGGPVTKDLVVPAKRRTTVAVHSDSLGVGSGHGVSAKVESQNGVGIIVERPMYFQYSDGIDGGHNVMGAASARPVWYFAEGYTGTGFNEYLTILNPNTLPADVAISYYLEGGTPHTTTLTVPATSRRTVVVHEASQGVGRGHAVAAGIESSNGVTIVVERPIYFIYGSGIDGGHNVLGHAP